MAAILIVWINSNNDTEVQITSQQPLMIILSTYRISK